jgi:hypothetical protein
MADLSPAAQAVLAALTISEYGLDPADIPNEAQRMAYHASVAIRAAAEQVVPPAVMLEYYERNESPVLGKALEIRSKLLALATELEGSNG